ncbi:MAG: hypothetical protein ACLFTT_00825 [Candidatus Hydrogenedentota bacterium]
MIRVCVNTGLLVLVLLMPAFALAQEEPSPDAPAPEETAAETPKGDVIHLRNGRKLEGFQVINQGTTHVQVRLTASGIKLRLPRSQIVSIEYDDTGGSRSSETEGREATNEKLLHGEKLAPALNRRLQKPLSDEPIRVEDEDFVQRVIAFGQRAQVPLSVSEAVQDIPARQRRWTTEIPANRSLFQVLSEHLLKDFPLLAVSYHFDEIVLTHASEGDEPEAPEQDERADGEPENSP